VKNSSKELNKLFWFSRFCVWY